MNITIGNVDVGVMALVDGDAPMDDRVSLWDLNYVLQLFASADLTTDLDGSDVVGVFDLQIVLQNFTKHGDP